jgi:REP-associated tyrosine transposase
MASRSNRNIVFSCQDHVVFCRKYRRQVLVNGVERRLQQISAEVAEETDSIWAETEVMPDHVHLLIEVDPRFGIHRVVKAIKGRSSRSLRNEFARLKSRLPTLWTNSDFVSTVGGAPLAVIKRSPGSRRSSLLQASSPLKGWASRGLYESRVALSGRGRGEHLARRGRVRGGSQRRICRPKVLRGVGAPRTPRLRAIIEARGARPLAVRAAGATA